MHLTVEGIEFVFIFVLKSMGRSLTFEQSVMKAMARQKLKECRNPQCEVSLWKERHSHDLSLMYINKLREQLE